MARNFPARARIKRFVVSVHAERTPMGTFIAYQRKTLNEGGGKAKERKRIVAAGDMLPRHATLIGILAAIAPIPPGSRISIQASNAWALQKIHEKGNRLVDRKPPFPGAGWYIRAAQETLLNSSIRAWNSIIRARQVEIPTTPEDAVKAVSLHNLLADIWEQKAWTLAQHGSPITTGWACDTGFHGVSGPLRVGFTRNLPGGFPGRVLYRIHIDQRLSTRIHPEVFGCLVTHIFARTTGGYDDAAPVIFNDFKSAGPQAEKARLSYRRKPTASPFEGLLSRLPDEPLDIRWALRCSTEALRLADKGTRNGEPDVVRTVDMRLEEMLTQFDEWHRLRGTHEDLSH